MLSKEVKELLQDPEAIWEAMSIDGVSYPFDTELEGKTAGQKWEIQARVAVFDNERARSIGNMILAYQGQADRSCETVYTDAIIGSIVRKQIIKHLERIAESK